MRVEKSQRSTLNAQLSMKKADILAIGVHPDDIELACSGTLLRHIEQGKTVALLDLTRGELGSRGSAEIRDAESMDAAQLMGAIDRKNLAFQDGFFTHDKAHLLEIVKMIRYYRPDIVLANAVMDRHPDHGRAGKTIADACFLSGLRRIETKYEEREQEHWRPKVVYHYVQDYYIKPDFVVDITPYVDKKIELVMAYKSQFFNPNSNEPETPISSKSFLEALKAQNRVMGRPAGFEFGEGFTVNRTLGVTNLFDLS